MMTKHFGTLGMVLICCGLVSAQALDTEKWPPSTDFTKEVHFWAAEDFLPIPQGSPFVDSLMILTGGDQVAEDIVIGGKAAK